MIEKLVTGGQTGVDRASLDVALELGIPCGGWCPKGRWAEDGAIAARYPLTETPSEKVEQRTEWNARDSDGTLIVNEGPLTGGTLYTAEMADRHGRPYLVIDLLAPPADPRAAVADWVASRGIRVLNVAGPRESTHPGINAKAKALLRRVLERKR